MKRADRLCRKLVVGNLGREMEFLRKNKLLFDIIAFIVFAFASYLFFDEYFEDKKQKIKLVTAIANGLMAVIKMLDLINKNGNRSHKNNNKE
jgi:hypothetical protein